MPLVSATDIPYRGFPEGRTSPQAPSDYQQIPTSPQMFGSIGAEALQQAGQQGEKLATEIARIGAYQQHYLDRTEEDKLSSQLDDAAHARKYGDPTAGLDANGNPLVPGFKNRYGSDAIDYIKSGQPSKDFNDDVTRIAASASNDRVREMFLRQSRARRTAFDTSLDEHWTSQLAAYSDQVRKGTNIGIDRDLAVGYNDDQIVQSKIHDKIALYVRDEKDPVIAGGKYFLAVHDGAKQLIDAALADNNPTRAAEIFNAYKDHMSGSDQISLWNSIHPALDNQTIAGAILGTSQKRPGGGGMSTNAAEHYNTAISLGASPNEAALLTSAAGAESWFDPTKSHDGGIGYGLYGHNDTRLAAMQQQFGPRPTAAQQIQFALNELRSRPEGARVNAAKTPEELTALQFEFEQPKRGPTDQADRRLATTREYMTNPPKASAGAGVAGVVASPPAGGPDVIERALKVSGQRENSAALAKYLHDGGVDMDPKTLAWCAGFVNATLAQQGMQGTGSLVATSFSKWGNPIASTDDVKRGDVAVITRGLPAGVVGGHVGFATGNKRVDPDTGKPQIEMLAGNERVDPNNLAAGHRVATNWYDADAVTLRRAPGEASAYRRGTQAAAATPGAVPALPATDVEGSPIVPPASPSAHGAAPPAAVTPRAATTVPGGAEIVAAGDSIGVGLNRENKLAGSSADDVRSPDAALSDAAGSRNPQQTLDYARTHPERFAGKNVLWSTGLFNAGGPEKARAALAKVGEQIDALKEAKAANIVLVGLDKGRFADLNAELAKVAADKGVQFAGPLPTDNIHPSKRGYRDYYASASKLFPGTAPGPRPSGMIEPGNIGPPT